MDKGIPFEFVITRMARRSAILSSNFERIITAPPHRVSIDDAQRTLGIVRESQQRRRLNLSHSKPAASSGWFK